MSSRAGKLRFDAVEDDGRGRMGTAAVEVDGADREGLSFAAAEFLSFFKGLLRAENGPYNSLSTSAEREYRLGESSMTPDDGVRQ